MFVRIFLYILLLFHYQVPVQLHRVCSSCMSSYTVYVPVVCPVTPSLVSLSCYTFWLQPLSSYTILYNFRVFGFLFLYYFHASSLKSKSMLYITIGREMYLVLMDYKINGNIISLYCTTI